MKDFMNRLGELQPATLVLLIFAAILLLLLLVLIIVTIKVLKSSDDDDYEQDEPKGKAEDDSDEEEEEEDETSRKVNEAVKSVEETKAKVEAEKIAKAAKKEQTANDDEDRESAKARVEEIAKAVKKDASDSEDDEDEEEYEEQEEQDEPEDSEEYEEEYEDEYEEDSSDDDDEELEPDDEATGELDTVKIREALAKEKREAEESGVAQGETARERAESPEYNASFDSAFVEKPDNDTDKPEPLIPNPTPDITKGKTLDAAEEAIVAGAVKAARSGGKAAKAAKSAKAAGKTAVKTADKASAKQKKKQSIEKPASAVAKGSSKYYWYNEQDMEGLARQEDRYFKYHYFDDADDAILDLVTEMYDCAYVRTEQLQRIAYGITFKSLGMKEILQSEEDLGFNINRATKEPTEDDKEEVYIKWCEYVDSFQEIIKIEAPTEVKVYIKEKMYEYGRKDVEELMHSPY